VSVVWGSDAVRRDDSVVIFERDREEVAIGAARLPAPSFYAQRVGTDAGLVGLSELAAEVWRVDARGDAEPIAVWPMVPEPPRPHPGVRLARGASDGRWVFLGPLRTTEDSAAIYRLPRTSLTAHDPER
jgi:hypothetical protein